MDIRTTILPSAARVCIVLNASRNSASAKTRPTAGFVTGRDGNYADLQSRAASAHNQAVAADLGFGIGIAAGVGAALAASRLVTTLLFGVEPTDAVSVGAAMMLMVAVSGIAAYLPARRAARVDPMVALHYE